MNKILHATEIKPNFNELKATWTTMLSKYFTLDGKLKHEFEKHVNCPYCDEKSQSDEFNLNGFRHVKCAKCETLYVSPRLNDKCIEELYSNEYYSEMYQNSMIPIFDQRKEKIGKSKYGQILNHSKVKNGRVLDIGAGIGEVSSVFKDNGWSTHLTEMNKSAIEWLRSRNHDEVFHGAFDQYKSEHKFDVIMAWGVVEHVVDPINFLKKACSMLKPNGIFVSEVPHGNCLLADYAKISNKDPERILMGEQHIVLYSINAYENIHTDANFKKVHVQTNGLDFSTILKINNLALPDHFISEVQNSIDSNQYGDLIRGFWTV